MLGAEADLLTKQGEGWNTSKEAALLVHGLCHLHASTHLNVLPRCPVALKALQHALQQGLSDQVVEPRNYHAKAQTPSAQAANMRLGGMACPRMPPCRRTVKWKASTCCSYTEHTVIHLQGVTLQIGTVSQVPEANGSATHLPSPGALLPHKDDRHVCILARHMAGPLVDTPLGTRCEHWCAHVLKAHKACSGAIEPA